MNRQEQPITLVKLGGSLITKANVPFGVDLERMVRLVKEVITQPGRVILVHGLGSFGKSVLGQHTSDYFTRHQYLLAADFEYAARQLSLSVGSVFRTLGHAALELAPIGLFQADHDVVTMKSGDVVRAVLELGITPIVRGGLLVDRERGPFACSADDLTAALAQQFGVRKTIFATNVRGVYRRWPARPRGKIIPEISVDEVDALLPQLGGVRNSMAFKVRCAAQAVAAGGECLILDGRIPGRLAAAVGGERVQGTRLTCPIRGIGEGSTP